MPAGACRSQRAYRRPTLGARLRGPKFSRSVRRSSDGQDECCDFARASDGVEASSSPIALPCGRWLEGEYWFDCAVFLALVLVGAGLWRDAHEPGRVIVKNGGLKPFHVIAPTDLRISCQSNTPPPSQLSAKIVGRYSSEYLPSCSLIDPKRLSKGAPLTNELDDRIVVRLKVQATNLFAGMHPPFKATVLAAPRERATTALLLNDVIVLDLQKDGEGASAVVALPSADAPTLTSFVAHSDLFLVTERP